MRFSERAGQAPVETELSKLTRHARAAGQVRADLTLASPSAAGINYPAGLLDPLSNPRGIEYRPEALGSVAAREAVAALYAERGLPISPQDVVITASSSEAYAYLFKLCCDPGDSALAPQPSYPLFADLARLDGVSLAHYRLAYDGAWHLAPEPLEPLPRTRLVLAVSPNNPTGSCLSRAELQRLATLRLPICSDEVFAAYLYTDSAEPGPPSALAAGLPVPVFALGGLSKELGLPGLKLGWLVLGGSQEYREEALARLELIADTYLSVNSPVEYALPELLAAAAPVRRAIQQRVRQNLSRLRERLLGSAASLLLGQGGWYACIRLPATTDEDSWVKRLLAQGVLVQPGYYYDLPIEPCIIVSLLTPAEHLDLGVGVLLELLHELS